MLRPGPHLEFAGLWKYIADWQNVFKHFDRDQSGSIDGHELAEGAGHGHGLLLPGGEPAWFLPEKALRTYRLSDAGRGSFRPSATMTHLFHP